MGPLEVGAISIVVTPVTHDLFSAIFIGALYLHLTTIRRIDGPFRRRRFVLFHRRT